MTKSAVAVLYLPKLKVCAFFLEVGEMIVSVILLNLDLHVVNYPMSVICCDNTLPTVAVI